MIYDAIVAVFCTLLEANMKFVNDVLFPAAHEVAKFGRKRSVIVGNKAIEIVDDVAEFTINSPMLVVGMCLGYIIGEFVPIHKGVAGALKATAWNWTAGAAWEWI